MNGIMIELYEMFLIFCTRNAQVTVNMIKEVRGTYRLYEVSS
jgi:hypothetical protein